MSKPRQKGKKLKKRLFTKNRLVILNEDSFEEVFSLRLTLMNVFVVATLGAVVIITMTTLLIAFTPLREIIPGYSSGQLRRHTTELALRTDSIQQLLSRNQAYLQSVRKALAGEVEFAKLNKDSIQLDTTMIDPEGLSASEAELALRQGLKPVPKPKKKSPEKLPKLLTLPLRASVISKFDLKKNQSRVSLRLIPDDPIRLASSGTLIFKGSSAAGGIAGFQFDNGYLLMVRGVITENFKTNDRFQQGEMFSKSMAGKPLDLELWYEGQLLDPEKIIDFN